MKKHITNIILLLLLCILMPTLLSCAQNKERLLKAKQERFQDGMRLQVMMSKENFKQALPFLDTLKAKYPQDPQFPFAEGCIYDMQGNSKKARPAFEKSLSLYDSIIATDPNSEQEINRLIIVQILYGKETYKKALEVIIGTPKNRKDSIWWEAWRDFDYNSSRKNLFDSEFHYCKDKPQKK